jgi:4-amino-4-deoxy-L-arabinose transferase-like glycosyltransferase
LAIKAGGRVLPGRLSFELDWAALAAPLLGVAVVLASRIPFRTRYLLNWDATQFALGMTNFDVVHHQPHPPGYLVYVAAGRLLLPLFGDPNSALVALSIIGECAAVVLAFFFAREVFGEWAGWVASLALAVAPLFWYYGEAANTYALEPATVMLVAWPCWRLWRGDASGALPAGLALGLAGAIRPSTAFFLLPLVLLSLRRAAPLRVLGLSVGASVLVTLAWLLPLVIMAGGPGA